MAPISDHLDRRTDFARGDIRQSIQSAADLRVRDVPRIDDPEDETSPWSHPARACASQPFPRWIVAYGELA